MGQRWVIFGHFYLNHLSPLWGYFSHDAIGTAIYFSELMSCKEFSVVVAVTLCEHLR